MLRGWHGPLRWGLILWALQSAEVARGSDPDQAPAGPPAASRPSSPIGFAPGSRAKQLEAEALAVAVPTPENARKWLKALTEEPHVAGTQADHKTAVFVRDLLREW